jgi:hypothetical protein
VQNPVQLEIPSDADLAKLLITAKLQSAEAVELADTPSEAITSAILYKLLILRLLPFASIYFQRSSKKRPVAAGKHRMAAVGAKSGAVDQCGAILPTEVFCSVSRGQTKIGGRR